VPVGGAAVDRGRAGVVEVVRVRAPKTRSAPAYRWHAVGNFTCLICKRKFPNKAGLSRHVEIVHTEGTFREEGFPCVLCPRLFDRLGARTQHYNRDHVRDSSALSCPHCAAVFPGAALMRLHIAEQHPVQDSAFPSVCQLCVAQGVQDPPVMSTSLTFKRHRTTSHLHDKPVLVYAEL
jgi:hypothetical protein